MEDLEESNGGVSGASEARHNREKFFAPSPQKACPRPSKSLVRYGYQNTGFLKLSNIEGFLHPRGAMYPIIPMHMSYFRIIQMDSYVPEHDFLIFQ